MPKGTQSGSVIQRNNRCFPSETRLFRGTIESLLSKDSCQRAHMPEGIRSARGHICPRAYGLQEGTYTRGHTVCSSNERTNERLLNLHQKIMSANAQSRVKVLSTAILRAGFRQLLARQMKCEYCDRIWACAYRQGNGVMLTPGPAIHRHIAAMQ